MILSALDRSKRSFGREVVLALGVSFVLSSWSFVGPWFTLLWTALLARLLWKSFAEESFLPRFSNALFLVAGLLALAALVVSNLSVPYHPWSAIRSAWPAGILHGYDLYYNNGGPIIGRMYGPVFPLIYTLPASLHDFKAIIHAGSLMSMLLYFTPVMLIFMRCVRTGAQTFVPAAFYVAVFVLLTFLSPALKHAAFAVHVDAPALGLGAAACFMLIRRERPSVQDLFISSVFIVLAFWSKQTAAPLTVALPVYVWIAYGRKAFREYFLCIVIVGVASTLIFGAIFGFKAMFFEMFVIPARQPSYLAGNWWMGMIAAMPFLMEEVWIYCAVFSLLSVVGLIFRRRHEYSLVQVWINLKPSVLFLITGICMVPVSLLGRMKVGGAENTLSPSAFYWAIAATLVFVNLYYVLIHSSYRKKRFILGALTMMGLLFNVAALKLNRDLNGLVRHSPYKVSDQVLAFIREHPGEVYFPCHNLEHLLIEGRAYHNLDGLLDRRHSEVFVDPRQLCEFLPSNIKYIAVDAELLFSFSFFLRTTFPDFNKTLIFKDLPDFTVMVREFTYDAYVYKIGNLRAQYRDEDIGRIIARFISPDTSGHDKRLSLFLSDIGRSDWGIPNRGIQ